MTNQVTRAETTDSAWKGLYRVGGAAILIAVLLFRRNFGAEITLFSEYTVPDTAIDWFTLLQSNKPLGLAYLEIFDIINYALVGLMFLALYGCPQASQQKRHGDRYGLWLCRDSGLLCFESGFLHAYPQQPIRGCNNRCAEIYVPGSRGGVACHQ